jgi:hypothetical protein
MRTSGSSTTSADDGIATVRCKPQDGSTIRAVTGGEALEIDENGVVNPLRLPAVLRDALRSLAGLPPLALVFAALALVVLVARVVEVHAFAPVMLGNVAVVLFPAAVLLHRRDAPSATPDLFRGAVLIAVAEIAEVSIRALSAVGGSAVSLDPLDPGPLWLAAAVVLGLAAAAGWWVVARAIAARTPVAGRGRLIVAAIVAGSALATGLGSVILYGTAGFRDIGTLSITLLGVAPSWLVAARLGWVTVTRAGGDPRPATWAAAAGAAVQAIGALPLFGIAFVVMAGREEAWIQAQTLGITIQLMAFVASPILFLLAFALGVGDVAPPHRPRAEAEAPAG